jgi:hypothetical protein
MNTVERLTAFTTNPTATDRVNPPKVIALFVRGMFQGAAHLTFLGVLM